MMNKKILLIASGDLRLSANQNCWYEQNKMEESLIQVVKDLGYEIERAHKYDSEKRHGFISSQKEGMEVFSQIDRSQPIIVAEAVWQYSHHVLSGLISHEGPILTLANWSGKWPGLVGMLNLNGSLTKAGVNYSSLWSEDFSNDKLFQNKFKIWLDTGSVNHDIAHVKKFKSTNDISKNDIKLIESVKSDLNKNKAILGVFDEFCMGMYNATIPDEFLFDMGVYKERLSQSALYAEMQNVSDQEALAIYEWVIAKGFNFHFGENEETELTKSQVLQQCKMYIAACRIGDEFGCDAIGIQYQQGLKDICPASDLVEGMLNSSDRPQVKNKKGEIIFQDEPFTHFNEVDECCGLDALITKKLHMEIDQPLEITLHDLRWGDYDQTNSINDYIWVFLISGAAPVEHHIDGWKGSHGYRQPSMYFPKGGSTLHGIAKPGEIIWSRIYIENKKLNMDIGLGGVVNLPEEETKRRLEETTPEWPIMHAITYGVTRDQMMAKHKANHLNVVYASDHNAAINALKLRAELARQLGIEVFICGTNKYGNSIL